jgi:hypothetical protein
MGPVLLDGAHVERFTCQKPKPRFVWADPEADGRGGGGGGGGSVGRPTPKSVANPLSAEPKGVSTPTSVPSDAEAAGAGSTGGGGGGGSVGALTPNPKSPPPEASPPISSAIALAAPASEKASAAATALVIFKVVRTVDSDNKLFPLSVVGFGTTPRWDANKIDRRAQVASVSGLTSGNGWAPTRAGKTPRSTASTPECGQMSKSWPVGEAPATATTSPLRRRQHWLTLDRSMLPLSPHQLAHVPRLGKRGTVCGAVLFKRTASWGGADPRPRPRDRTNCRRGAAPGLSPLPRHPVAPGSVDCLADGLNSRAELHTCPNLDPSTAWFR